jgi:uncharacterized protein
MPMRSAFEIQSVKAERGQIARSFLAIGETAIGPIQIPLVIVHGDSDGPTLCLTAGVHATEYAPIDAVFRILAQLDPKILRGTIIAVPIVSMHMFASRCGFVSPIDGLNLNKVAPGGNGSISEILVKFLLDQVIARAQYHVDLHAGDLGEMLSPFGGCSLTQNNPDLDREGEAIARLYTPRLICLSRDGVNLPPFPGSIVHAAARMGVVSILAESGGNGTLEEADVLVHINGIRNIMRYLKMIDGEPSIPGPQIIAIGREITRAKRSGLLRLKVRIGDAIADGQAVAEICDVFGQTIETVRCIKGGIAGLIWAHKSVSTGDPIIRCWYYEPAPPFPTTDRFMI